MFDRVVRLAQSIGVAEYGVESDPEAPVVECRLTVGRRIDAPPARAWEVVANTCWWPEWGPSITAVEPAREPIEAGTRGRVRVVGGLWVPFVVDSCTAGRDTVRRWTWRVGGVRATGHRVKAYRPEQSNETESAMDGSRVVFEVPLIAAPYAVICAYALDRIERLASRTAG